MKAWIVLTDAGVMVLRGEPSAPARRGGRARRAPPSLDRDARARLLSMPPRSRVGWS
ncbi:Hypothetical protein A7982_01116 [Minicystis rosea]|nr:Hypothetical protein A7982_01116 [Minicystis rosea]